MPASEPIPPPPSAEGWRAGELWLLFGITLLAAVVRLFRVEDWSMAPAEVATWQAVTMPLHGEHGFFASAAGGQPLVLLALRWLLDAGVLPFHGEGWLRLPFVFVGVVTVPLLALAAGLVQPRRTALLAAGLLAVHPSHVAQSQAVLPAVVALAFTLLAATAALAAPRRWPRTRTAVCLVAAVLACASDRCGVVVLPLLAGGWAAARWPAAARGQRALWTAVLLAGVALPGVLFAAWHWPFPPQVAGEPARWWTCVWSFTPAVVLLALLAPWVGRSLPRPLVVAALLPIGGLGLAAAAGAAIEPTDLFALLPLFVLLAAATAMATADRVRANATGIAAWAGAVLVPAALATWLVVDTVLYASVYQGHRSPWRQAANIALGAGSPAHGLIVGAREGSNSLTFYLRPNHWRGLPQDPHPGIRVDRLDGDLQPAIAALLREAGTARVLVVLRRDELEALPRDPASGLLADCRLLRVLPCPREHGDGTLYVFASGPRD